MKRSLRVLLTAAMTVIFSFCLAFPVGAQENEDNDDIFMLEEITVTAEKSEENLQKVSRSLAVISAEELRKTTADDMQDILGNTGGVSFMGFFNQIYIRGVGQVTNEVGSEPSVQFNVDGSVSLNIENYTTNPMLQATNDVERVEVIRGPSGSVNGRSAAAGTINVISKSPKYEELDGNVGITIGNFDTIRTNAAVNLPLGLTGLDLPSYLENLSFRVATSENKHEAYIHNADGEDVSGMENYFTMRTKMKWQPIDPLTINASFTYTEDASDQSMTVPPIGGAPGLAGVGSAFYFESHEDDPWLAATSSEMSEPDHNKQYSESLEVTYDTGIGTFTGRYGYSWVPVECDPGDTNCYEGDMGQKEYEVRLNSPEESKIKWMVGGYMFHKEEYTGPEDQIGEVDEDTDVTFFDFYGSESNFTDDSVFDPTSPNPGMDVNDITAPWSDQFTPWIDPVVPGQVAIFKTADATRPIDAYSFYGNITVPLFEDKHRFVLGLRKNIEEKKRVISVGVFSPDDSYGGYPHFTFEADDDDSSTGQWICDNCTLVASEEPHELTTSDNPITYTVGWEYDWLSEVMLYAQVSNGFKPGGISPNAIPNIEYKPEYLTNYAIGTKSRWFDSRVQINAEAFLMNYKNYQTNLAADSASISYMIDGVTYIQPYGFQSRTVNFGSTDIYGVDVDYDWLITARDRLNGNMEYKHAEFGDLKYRLGKGSFPPGLPEYTDFKGKPMPWAPKFTFNGSYSHIFNYGNYQITPKLSAKYSTKYFLYNEYWWSSLNPEMWQSAYWEFDAYLNIGPQDGSWNINIYGKNLTEEVIRNASFFTGCNISDPRTYGVSFKVKF